MKYTESETVELKRCYTTDIKKEIIAFANTVDGTIYVGIDDDGGITGVDSYDAVSLQISNSCRDSIRPDVTMFIHMNELIIEDRHVVEIKVQKGTSRPYYLADKGLKSTGVYVRQGSSSAPASDAVIRQMIKETDGDVFEEMRSLNQSLTFDFADNEFRKRNVAFGRAQKQTLGLVNADGEYTNLGLLLSDQCPHIIKAAAFRGTVQGDFQDRKEFGGSLFRQLNECYAYLDMWNFKAATINGLYRTDNRNYPPDALREALLNAIVHRDYSVIAPILVSVYDDRVEIVSIGGLCNGLLMQDVLAGISVCRNAKLANVFYRLDLIEVYGTGLAKIINSYKKYSFEPVLAATPNTFKAILPNTNMAETEGTEPEDSRENILLKLIKEKGKLSRAEIEKMSGLSQSTVIRTLGKLKSEGYIKVEGFGKNTRYAIGSQS